MSEVKSLFLKRQITHIRRVQDNMFLLENNLDRLPFRIKDFELVRRAALHDLDKVTFRINNYFKIFQYHRFTKEGIGDADSVISYDTVAEYATQHYLSQRHHLEYHIKNKAPLNNIDICEMACDMYAIKEELGETAEETEKFVVDLCEKFSVKNAVREKLLFLLDLLGEFKK